MQKKILTVCGGGNGAQALAALAGSLRGWEVRIYAPWQDEAQMMQEGLRINGGLETVGRYGGTKSTPAIITNKPTEAAANSDLVMLVAPAFSHRPMLEELVPHLPDGVVIGAMPARSGFEYTAMDVLKKHNKKAVVCGLQTLPWACRIRGYGQKIELMGKKEAVGLAAVPASAAPKLISMIQEVLGVKVYPIDNMLAVTLANIGQVVHPGIMYGLFKGYQGELYGEKDIPLFYQGMVPQIAAILTEVSMEIRNTALAINNQYPQLAIQAVKGVEQWLKESYAHSIEDDSTLTRAFVTNRDYDGLKAPMRKEDAGYRPDFANRYLVEDVPYGLVVTRAVADLAQVETPTIDEVITAAGRWIGKEYLLDGQLIGQHVSETRIPQNYGITTLEQLVNFTVSGDIRGNVHLVHAK